MCDSRANDLKIQTNYWKHRLQKTPQDELLSRIITMEPFAWRGMVINREGSGDTNEGDIYKGGTSWTNSALTPTLFVIFPQQLLHKIENAMEMSNIQWITRKYLWWQYSFIASKSPLLKLLYVYFLTGLMHNCKTPTRETVYRSC